MRFTLILLLWLVAHHARASERILMIGDSLTVGSFGRVIAGHLLARRTAENVIVRAACGSSPEHWLEAEPEFIAKCGYRELTDGKMEVREFDEGVAPPPYHTPALEALMRKYRPGTVIVQLGTNWMDDMLAPGGEDEEKYRARLARFATALRTDGQSPQVIWITPPDSAHFPKRAEALVDKLLKAAAKTHHFDLINSGALTHYVTGQTGGDGVHYRREAAEAWAQGVVKQLDRKLR